MVKTIRRLVNYFGFDVVRRSKKGASKKTRYSRELSFYKTLTGNYYLPADAHNDIIAKTIRQGKVFEPEVVALASKYIRPNQAVLDVGSNFGQMAILFSRCVGDHGKVYAFDADDFVFEVLKKNIAANGLEAKVIPTFGAVHNVSNETLYFPVQDFERFETYGSYGIDYKGNKGRAVPTIAIDDMNISGPVCFMKVDVQGGDLFAMQGAVKLIERNRMPILFEYEYHFEDELDMCFQDYVDFVRDIGYRFKKVINGHNFLIVPK